MEWSKLFSNFQSCEVLVLGDVMLDTYWWGHVERISPEAPVPVVAVDKKEIRAGGAANVALNVRALGAVVHMVSIVGEDEAGEELTNLIQQQGIQTQGIIKSSTRRTTNKTRIISRNQHMMRLDEEDTFDINEVDSQLLLGHVDHLLSSGKIKVLIFEDYNKGLLSEQLIQHVLELCKKYQVITTVDPKRKNFLSYKGVDVFKPNLKEVKDALGIWVDQVHLSELEEVHQQLKKYLHHSVSLITLSEKGVFCKNNQDAFIIPSYVRNIADVSGAGDTVIAVASLVYALTKDIKWMAEIANVAAGQVCEEVGTVAVDADRLLDELQNLYPNGLA